MAHDDNELPSFAHTFHLNLARLQHAKYQWHAVTSVTRLFRDWVGALTALPLTIITTHAHPRLHYIANISNPLCHPRREPRFCMWWPPHKPRVAALARVTQLSLDVPPPRAATSACNKVDSKTCLRCLLMCSLRYDYYSNFTKAAFDLTRNAGSQIFRFLHPRDLLNLARTSKDFRALLLNRSSALFWKTSRKQIEGLPEIPDHVSEPAYANLLFCNHCHVGGHAPPTYQV